MILLEAIWFFLPAGLANMAPIFAKHIKILDKLDYPLDFNKSVGGKRIFGDHKTMRGLLAGTVVAIIFLYLQTALYINHQVIESISLIDYTEYSPALLGFLFSFGALGGDAIKSFFKRRSNLLPGQTWVPFDQIDYIIGGLLATSILIDLSLNHTLMVFVVWAILHPISTYIGFLLKLKDSPI